MYLPIVGFFRSPFSFLATGLQTAVLLFGIVPPSTTGAADQFPSRVKSFLVEAETSAKQTCSDVPPEFWTWLDSKPHIKKGMLSAHDPVRPNVVHNLYFLTQEFPQERVERYVDLLLAVSVVRSHETIRDEASRLNQLPEVATRLAKEIEQLAAYTKASPTSLVDPVLSAFDDVDEKIIWLKQLQTAFEESYPAEHLFK